MKETNPQKELFNVQIGKVHRVTLSYGPNGQSKGVATIQFAQKGDAKKAYDRYDNKLIDNSKRLKVKARNPRYFFPRPPQFSLIRIFSDSGRSDHLISKFTVYLVLVLV